MLRAAMRSLSFVLLLLVVLAGCEDNYEPPLSYGRCNSMELCGLETRCDRVAASTSGAPALVCTLPCSIDTDCPGLDGVCAAGVALTVADGGLPGRCLRACTNDPDCRPGTLCRGLTADAGTRRVCVADLTP